MKTNKIFLPVGIMLFIALCIPAVSAQDSYKDPEWVYDCPLNLDDPVIYKYQYTDAGSFSYLNDAALAQKGLSGETNIFYVRAVKDAEGNPGVAVTNCMPSMNVRNLYKSTTTKELVDKACIQVCSEQLLLEGDDLDEATKIIEKTNKNLQRKAQNKSRSVLLKQEHDGYSPYIDDYTVVYIFKQS